MSLGPFPKHAAALVIFLMFSPCQGFAYTEEEADVVANRVVNEPYNLPGFLKVHGATASFLPGTASAISGEIQATRGATAGVGGKGAKVAGDASSLDGALGRLKAEQTGLETRIVLPAAILFSFDKYDLRPDAVTVLHDLLVVVKANKNGATRIEGHTDSIGTNEYNQVLSEKRANSVSAWLKKQGAALSRLSSIGLGETKPVDSNDTPAGRQNNRRVEIILEKKAKK